MQQLTLFYLLCGGFRQLESATVAKATAATVHGKACELWLTRDGLLQTAAPGSSFCSDALAKMAAVLWSVDEGGHQAWYLTPRNGRVAINGSPPLPLARLEPGDLLAVDQTLAFASTSWAPVAQAAPADIADKPCPLCGEPLSVASVVQCPDCGLWTHLERPEEPDSTEALNCHLLGGQCSQCHRTASLERILIPEPPEKLMAAMHSDAGAWLV